MIFLTCDFHKFPEPERSKYLRLTWKSLRNANSLKITGLERLIDNSDLDRWIENYDWSKVGDVEYHKFCGDKKNDCSSPEPYNNLYDALLNLSSKATARESIIASRLLLIDWGDFEDNKFQNHEEEVRKRAEKFQLFDSLHRPKTDLSEEQQQIINKALDGDIELLSRLQGLPYIAPWIRKIIELDTQLQEERTIHQDSLKAMDNFYQQNPPSEEQRLNNILKVFEPDYLKTNSENKQKEEKINQLKEEIKTIKQIAEQRIQELEQKVFQLENKQEQQIETKIEITPTIKN